MGDSCKLRKSSFRGHVGQLAARASAHEVSVHSFSSVSSTDSVDPLPTGSVDQITYTYDLFGNVTSADQVGIDSVANPATYSFLYDDVGKMVEALSPESQTTNETRTWTFASSTGLEQSETIGSGAAARAGTITAA